MNNVVNVVGRTVVQERVMLEIRINVVNVVNTLAKASAVEKAFCGCTILRPTTLTTFIPEVGVGEETIAPPNPGGADLVREQS
jgi:hypothetical protein